MRSVMCAVLLVAIVSTNALALGRDGHEAVCYIAYDQATQATRQKIDTLLASDPKYSQYEDPAEAFASSCNWADDVKPARWAEHFVNVPRTTKKITSLDCQEADKCLLSAIVSDAAVLRDPEASNEDKLKALKYMGHWIGDLHQPLHVSFKSDRGGNQIPVTNFAGYHEIQISDFKECSDLHAVWDRCFVAYSMGHEVIPDSTSYGRHLLSSKRSLKRKKYKGEKTLQHWANASFTFTTKDHMGYCEWVDGECVGYAEGFSPKYNGSDMDPVTYLSWGAMLLDRLILGGGLGLAELLDKELTPSND